MIDPGFGIAAEDIRPGDEPGESNNNIVTFRLRKVSGAGSPSLGVTINAWSPNGPPSFSPSSSTSTVSAPAKTSGDTVLFQAGGALVTAGSAPGISGCGAGANIDGNSVAGTITLGANPASAPSPLPPLTLPLLSRGRFPGGNPGRLFHFHHGHPDLRRRPHRENRLCLRPIKKRAG